MSTTKVNFLGIGSAFNTKLGNTSSFFIKDNELFVIDCGFDVFTKLKDYGLLDTCDKIHVFITHLHDDHIGSLSSLSLYTHFKLGKTVTIYHPGQYIILFLKGQGYMSACENKLNKSGIIKTEDHSIEYSFHLTDHVKELNSYSIKFIIEDETIYFSGDSKMFFTGDIPAKELLKGNTVIYQDTSYLSSTPDSVHMSLEKLKEIVSDKYRSKVYCVHIDDYDPADAIDCKFKVPEIYKPLDN